MRCSVGRYFVWNKDTSPVTSVPGLHNRKTGQVIVTFLIYTFAKRFQIHLRTCILHPSDLFNKGDTYWKFTIDQA